MNYLWITGLKMGIILDFQRAKLERERIVPQSVFIYVHPWLTLPTCD